MTLISMLGIALYSYRSLGAVFIFYIYFPLLFTGVISIVLSLKFTDSFPFTSALLLSLCAAPFILVVVFFGSEISIWFVSSSTSSLRLSVFAMCFKNICKCSLKHFRWWLLRKTFNSLSSFSLKPSWLLVWAVIFINTWSVLYFILVSFFFFSRSHCGRERWGPCFIIAGQK